MTTFSFPCLWCHHVFWYVTVRSAFMCVFEYMHNQPFHFRISIIAATTATTVVPPTIFSSSSTRRPLLSANHTFHTYYLPQMQKHTHAAILCTYYSNFIQNKRSTLGGKITVTAEAAVISTPNLHQYQLRWVTLLLELPFVLPLRYQFPPPSERLRFMRCYF